MTIETTKKSPGKRLLALDILRGITIAGMILVNNPGSWGHIYAPLAHAEWNGLTPTDLVFPFFMYIMGISTYFSLKKYDFTLSRTCLMKILRRTIVIFLIGIAIAWFGLFMRGILSDASFADAVFNFDRIRILGVMPRLAICYGAGALIALTVRRGTLPWVVGAMLLLYAVILLLGHGFEFSENNIIAVIDRTVLGEKHMYADTVGGIRLKFDPEGLLSTLPSIAHMLIGFVCGDLISRSNDNNLRVNALFIVGTILTFSGFLLDFGLPVNKKIWSPSFVLTTCGLASSFLALLVWIIDIRGYRRWCRFFEVFGINPLFLYCLGAVLSILVGTVKIPYSAVSSGMISIKGWIYEAVLTPLCLGNPTLASLLFALLMMALNWSIGLILYRKKIYIKI